MITKDADKGDDKKLKDQSKNNSSESRTIQEFKIKSRRIQDLKNQDQDSRIKRRLNQDKYKKFFSKNE